MDFAPELSADLVSSPTDPSGCFIKVEAGTNYGFSVHVRPSMKGDMLPMGEYIFDYIADCGSESADNTEI